MNGASARFVILLSLLSILVTAGCGSSNRKLQSIAISNVGNTVQLQLTATGTFNRSPASVTPLAVDWFVTGPGIPPLAPPPGSYVLSGQPFATACATGNTAIALAPANPDAPNTGSIPTQAFEDLVVKRTTSAEGGFVAVSQTIACP